MVRCKLLDNLARGILRGTEGSGGSRGPKPYSRESTMWEEGTRNLSQHWEALLLMEEVIRISRSLPP